MMHPAVLLGNTALDTLEVHQDSSVTQFVRLIPEVQTPDTHRNS
jgi:hypothetical protein